jgi:hypothetical protein
MRALLVVLALAGCAGQTPPSTCNADNWAELIGQPEEALYGAYANLRVIRPDTDVTDDLNPNRLNAVIGADGRIKKFGCY